MLYSEERRDVVSRLLNLRVVSSEPGISSSAVSCEQVCVVDRQADISGEIGNKWCDGCDIEGRGTAAV
jgi:hypothetical protein